MNPIQPQSLFLQVVERICDGILSGKYPEGARIPSVREMAALHEVNPNTIVKAYDRLLEAGIVTSQQAVGFFIAEEAPSRVLASRRESFYSAVLPSLAHEMDLLNIPTEEFVSQLQKLRQPPQKNKE